MATWKKLVTYNDGSSQITGNITGKAHGGFDGILEVSSGGTGVDTSGWTSGSMPMFSGGSWMAISPPTGEGQVLSSQSAGNWGWVDASASHSHDNYLETNSTSEQTVTGNLKVTGGLVANSMQVTEFTQITATDTSHVSLNTSGGSADGDDCGLYCDRSGDTTIATDDPAILWDATDERWTAGKYNSQMYQIGLVDLSTSIDFTQTYNGGAGFFACDASTGAVYISV